MFCYCTLTITIKKLTCNDAYFTLKLPRVILTPKHSCDKLAINAMETDIIVDMLAIIIVSHQTV